MTGTKTIQVPLPEHAEPTREEIALLQSALEAIVDLCFRGTRAWEADAQALEQDGWSVRARLMWMADARKGAEYEEACGRTREEAFAKLREFARVDHMAGVP